MIYSAEDSNRLRPPRTYGFVGFAILMGMFGVFPSNAANAAHAETGLSLQSNTEFNPEPLTTEKIWQLDPADLNPQRTRWVLTKHVEISGMQAVPLPTRKGAESEGYSVSVGALYSKNVSYVRQAGDPSYSPLSAFPCTPTYQGQERFATEEGARIAVDTSARLWDDLLDREKFKLAVRLSHVRGEFPDNAIRDSHLVLAEWLDDLDREWKDRILPAARAEEWKFYKQEASENQICGSSRPKPLRWESLMESIPVNAPAPKLLARAPARRWGGLFSIRASMVIGGKALLGQFLIDSSAPDSVISPTFLQNQGALGSWIQIPKAHPQKISWSGGSGVAEPAYVAEVKVSGLSIPIHRFYIHETDFFGPPESFATCCDGILGADFLRQYSLEFVPGKTSEVTIYAREGYHASPGYPWVEAGFDSRREVVSDCTATGGRTQVLHGIRWDTGSEEALEANRTLVAADHNAGQRWNLSCANTRMASGIQITPKESDGINETTQLNAGMELIARSTFVFDLGHGRIWFSPNGLILPIVQNHSGLNLEYVFIDGDRYLKVMGIKPGSPAESLRNAGLQAGMTLVSLDSKSVDDMDNWEVEQRLSGVYSQRLTVEWKTGKRSTKLAAIQLPALVP